MPNGYCVGLVSERMEEVMREHHELAGRLNFMSGLVESTLGEKKKALRKAEWLGAKERNVARLGKVQPFQTTFCSRTLPLAVQHSKSPCRWLWGPRNPPLLLADGGGAPPWRQPRGK